MFIEARRETTPCPRSGGLRYLSGPNNVADMALLTKGGNVSSVCVYKRGPPDGGRGRLAPLEHGPTEGG